MTIDCASLSSSLIDSELFGHERGAFTDAVTARAGRFELAAAGTVYLDAVTELPLEGQGKLLRIVEDKRVERLGGHTSFSVAARIIASTHADIEDAVRGGTFRHDLFHRLRVLPLRVLPLRERPDDVLPLAKYFVSRLAASRRQSVPPVTRDAAAALRDYAWPGNVRELRHVVERAFESAARRRHWARRSPDRCPRGARAGSRHRPGAPAHARRGRAPLHHGHAQARSRQSDGGGAAARNQPESPMGKAQEVWARLTTLDYRLTTID